ncbi:hypothetical protein NSQ20_19320 [Paenibacillus sp. FSL K6-1122]|uniref:hypothetical protein n=1 Tax=Paenibacillus TaxID=44249 RepID=UPI0003E1B85D|nr:MULTISPECIES: hypothetical protein [Paenibacillus]ETT32706.1 hypothetical protein C161_22134 [Paenibacillus sp. FSL R5-192]OMF05460.1 hypothetical protein BK129_15895 [Paenibacillus amylolyticus]OMF46186.1 hypothetical protein BK136_05960 [Paenibacillus amylolyticus]
MKEVITASDLMEQLITMNKENSVCQVRIPGKGMYVIVLQDDYSTVRSSDQMLSDTENEASEKIGSEIKRNPFL